MSSSQVTVELFKVTNSVSHLSILDKVEFLWYKLIKKAFQRLRIQIFCHFSMIL